MLRLNLSFEAESVAALDDAARGGRGEMRADEGHALLRASLQEAAPGGAGLVEVNVEVGFPFRMSALYRMVDQVAGYHADLAARCDPYKDEVPEIPPELIWKTALTYVEAHERITGRAFEPPAPAPPVGERVLAALGDFHGR